MKTERVWEIFFSSYINFSSVPKGSIEEKKTERRKNFYIQIYTAKKKNCKLIKCAYSRDQQVDFYAFFFLLLYFSFLFYRCFYFHFFIFSFIHSLTHSLTRNFFMYFSFLFMLRFFFSLYE